MSDKKIDSINKFKDVLNDELIKNKSVKNKIQLVIKITLNVIIILIILNLGISLTSDIKSLISLKTNEIWPSSFEPVARFVANIDWNTHTVKLDATMSKAYQNNIEKYIWRIDDGTGLVGDSIIEHKFEKPGFYHIQLSIIDVNGQSDLAECKILIPPSELEKVSTTDTNQDGSITNNYSYVPKGEFFNYSKLLTTSYADLSSNYVDSECGLSSTVYNISDVNYNISYRNSVIKSSLANIVEFIIITFVLVFVNMFIQKKYLTKKAE